MVRMLPLLLLVLPTEVGRSDQGCISLRVCAHVNMPFFNSPLPPPCLPFSLSHTHLHRLGCFRPHARPHSSCRVFVLLLLLFLSPLWVCPSLCPLVCHPISTPLVCHPLSTQRENAVIKAASYRMCVLTLFANICLAGGAIFYAISAQSGSWVCFCRQAFAGLPVVVFMSALILKTFRYT